VGLHAGQKYPKMKGKIKIENLNPNISTESSIVAYLKLGAAGTQDNFMGLYHFPLTGNGNVDKCFLLVVISKDL